MRGKGKKNWGWGQRKGRRRGGKGKDERNGREEKNERKKRKKIRKNIKKRRERGRRKREGISRFPLSPPLSFFSIGLALTLARLTKPGF